MGLASVIDGIVGAFSPVLGVQRAQARRMLTRAYEGASKRDGWKPRRAGASANADHLADASELRTRARALVQNVPYISRGLAAHVSHIVGTGIMPRSMARRAGLAEKIDLAFQAFAAQADADGRLDLYGLMALAVRTMLLDGEVLIRLRPRRVEDGLTVPLQLQLLEIDWLDASKRGTSGTNGPNTIINGIEYDPLGRVINYWLFDQHPGDIGVVGRRYATSRPVSAASIIHLFKVERPGQGRGFTSLASVIATVRDLRLYEDAELARKNLETRLSVFVSPDVNTMANPVDPNGGGANSGGGGMSGSLGSLPSGAINTLPPGSEVTTVEPKASPGYTDYVKHVLHVIAAGAGWTYEMMTGDVSQVNFSSARVRMLDYRREVEQLQWATIIPQLCQRIWVAFLEAAELAGQIPAAADAAVEWSTPKWDYVNPEQDVKAQSLEIANGLSSISETLRRRGYKPDQVFDEIASDFAKLKASGALDVLVMLQKGKALDSAAPAGQGSA